MDGPVVVLDDVMVIPEGAVVPVTYPPRLNRAIDGG
jgi:hypothetical protein